MRQLALLVALLTGGPAMAQPASLPPEILGTWALEAGDCADIAGGTPDTRMLVTALVVERYASILTVREWRREGDSYRASAQVAEEGEDDPGPDLANVELRLAPDGQLVLRVDQDEPMHYTRCRDGLPLR